MKFIFEVTIKPGSTAQQYADAWVRASELIQRAPGARGTRLHRRMADPDTLLAIAEWDSKEQRDASQGNDPRVAEIIKEAARYCDIRVLGEFEEAEWVVLPPSGGVPGPN
jgi:heme-degrading monooxygenase HmoA